MPDGVYEHNVARAGCLMLVRTYGVVGTRHKFEHFLENLSEHIDGNFGILDPASSPIIGGPGDGRDQPPSLDRTLGRDWKCPFIAKPARACILILLLHIVVRQCRTPTCTRQ